MKTKFIIVSMGSGETSQSAAFGQYAKNQGTEVIFAIQREEDRHFFSFDKKQQDQVKLTPNSKSLSALVNLEKPDALVLCNSKFFGNDKNFQNMPIRNKLLTFSIDSNWLFSLNNKAAFPFVKWVDNYLINIPKKIFALGLKKHGGNYNIPQTVLAKIKVVGLIPSYQKPSRKDIFQIRKKYDIIDGEKLIFGYGGYGITNNLAGIEKLFPAAEKMVEQGFRIKVLYVGDERNIPSQFLRASWLLHANSLDVRSFYLALASSDLVYQHQGLGTLAQAISAQVPVITNVINPAKGKIEHTHVWEVAPFMRAGVCSMFYFNDSVSDRVQEMTSLLYDPKRRIQMQRQQKKNYSAGEPQAYKIIINKIKYNKAI